MFATLLDFGEGDLPGNRIVDFHAVSMRRSESCRPRPWVILPRSNRVNKTLWSAHQEFHWWRDTASLLHAGVSHRICRVSTQVWQAIRSMINSSH